MVIKRSEMAEYEKTFLVSQNDVRKTDEAELKRLARVLTEQGDGAR